MGTEIASLRLVRRGVRRATLQNVVDAVISQEMQAKQSADLSIDLYLESASAEEDPKFDVYATSQGPAGFHTLWNVGVEYGSLGRAINNAVFHQFRLRDELQQLTRIEFYLEARRGYDSPRFNVYVRSEYKPRKVRRWWRRG